MINNKTDYALRLLLNLAQKSSQGLVASRQIAEEEQIPPNFMPQIVAELVKKGWVESVRGPGGGVKLAVEPEEITVLDVISLFEALQVRPCL
ncbi:MAG TPA: Rrf2 family transcriptional regulator, partial [Bacillota bacterium]|nr:Rrf2 family transcriptional regulator [Bacillota bacterium]